MIMIMIVIITILILMIILITTIKVKFTFITSRTCCYVCILSLLCICTFNSIHFRYYQIKQLKSNTNIHKSRQKKRLCYNYQTGINIFYVAVSTLNLKLYIFVFILETSFYSTTDPLFGTDGCLIKQLSKQLLSNRVKKKKKKKT